MKETATESRPRVCVLTGSFHPVVGGGERHARLLCRELAARGLLVHVLTRRRTPESARREEMDGFTVVRVGPSGFSRLGKYLMLPAACFQLWRLRKKYDVVYVAGLRVLGWAGMLAQACLGKPCVLRAEARGEFSGEFIWKTPEGVIRLAPYLFFR
ncbi:MAG: glycosyltransferase, partial [Verrucomicrobiota bacterium]|nr:glycosyltransferase [Verrucomicrobiota bacterium]